MAIEKMKKLRLMAIRPQKDALFRELTKLGAIEVAEVELTEEEANAVSRESGDAIKLRGQHATVTSALKTLDAHAHLKDALLSPKPLVAAVALLENDKADEAVSIAEEIESYADTIKRANAEISRQGTVMESLAPWKSLDMPIDYSGSESTVAIMGTFPMDNTFATVEAALEKASELSQLYLVSRDDKLHYVVLVCHKSEQQAALEAVRAYGFAVASLGGMTGTPQENIDLCKQTVDQLKKEKADADAAIVAYADKRELLKLGADVLATDISRAEADDKIYRMDSTIIMQGWILASKVSDFEAICDKYDCAWELEDPKEEEYPDVPVKLRNNKFTNALNMVTNMYSLPAYDGVDPNPLMAPFFILFFGLMMADMGYGALMVIGAIVAMKKMKPREGTQVFCQLLLYSGISTFICGALTGGLFGDSLVQLGVVLGKPEGWGTLPCLFTPTGNTVEILIGSLVLGLIHMNVGMVVNFVERWKRGEYMDAIFEEGALWVTLVGAIMFAVPKLAKSAPAALGSVGKIVLIAGLVMVFYGGSRGAKGVGGKILSVFVTMYNQATGWFGDILSYCRIMALMLAGSVIATVFNTIGAMTGSILVYIFIFAIGHTLNFLLNLLGCYVHDLRLQCLEYFGKFYKDGGRAFNPMSVKTNYHDIEISN